MGVWIETEDSKQELSAYQSHPAWVCGLKHKSRRRGIIRWVTPCVGVWIETSNRSTIVIASRVTPCVGVWIETYRSNSYRSEMCHTLRGCVDWNSNAFLSKSFLIGHTLRGCVDWNRINGASFLTSAMSHPAWVCGLKLYLCLPILIAFGSHTLRGCVDWNYRRVWVVRL